MRKKSFSVFFCWFTFICCWNDLVQSLILCSWIKMPKFSFKLWRIVIRTVGSRSWHLFFLLVIIWALRYRFRCSIDLGFSDKCSIVNHIVKFFVFLWLHIFFCKRRLLLQGVIKSRAWGILDELDCTNLSYTSTAESRTLLTVRSFLLFYKYSSTTI